MHEKCTAKFWTGYLQCFPLNDWKLGNNSSTAPQSQARGRGRWLECHGQEPAGVRESPSCRALFTIYTPSSQSSARGHTGGHRRKVARGHGERVHCHANHHRAAQISLRFLPPNFVIISRILLRWWENVQNKMRSWRIALSFLPGRRLERESETSLYWQDDIANSC